MRAFIEIKNGKVATSTLNGLAVKIPLPDHCRDCHVIMNEMKTFQANLMEVGTLYIPTALAKKLEKIETNQTSIMKCQKEMLANQTKVTADLVMIEEHCEGRYKGTQRVLGELMVEARRHKDSVVRSEEILRLIKEHNLKSAKVIDSIMREKNL